MTTTKRTLYSFGGTGNMFDLFGHAYVPLGVGGSGGPVYMGQWLDTTLWDVVVIDYPAAAFPMPASIDTGISMGVDAINKTPGPFAIAGTSQGSMVSVGVWAEIDGGTLSSRAEDILASVQFGNPLRQQGHLGEPGAVDPGVFNIPGSDDPGHGCVDSSKRMTSVPSWWRDYANVGDPVTCVGDDTTGTLWQFLTSALLEFTGDPTNIIALLEDVGDLPADVYAIAAVYNLALPGIEGPHNGYATLPAWPGQTKTAGQLAAEYLNLIATNNGLYSHTTAEYADNTSTFVNFSFSGRNWM